MFDEINTNQAGKAPGNLPVSEPDDIFAATEAPEVLPSSAISAGKLQPRVSLPPVATPSLNETAEPASPNRGEPKVQTMPEESFGLNKIKNPIFAKNIMIGAIVLTGLGILGGGSFVLYNMFVKPADEINEFILPDNIDTTKPAEAALPKSEENTAPNNVENAPTDDAVLFGEPVDTDSDNLNDSQEKELGTNPNSWDSDNDGVSDGDEVLVWKSNPLNSDTDSDGFLDGAEITNGYNPIGAGKIFETPKL